MLSKEFLENFQSLSRQKQKEVINFINFLKSQEDELEEIMDNIIEENKIALRELGK